MALPGITAPPGTPVFLAIGHSVEEDSVHGNVPYSTGHSRTRRKQTSTERVVSVQWQLNPEQMAAVDFWFERTLKVGSLTFAALVKDEVTEGMAWWEARWVSAPQFDMQHYGKGRSNGRLFLMGEGQSQAPDTSSLAVAYSVELRSAGTMPAGNTSLAVAYSVQLLSIEGT